MSVSVVIPARDRERYIEEAIASVLGQSAPPAELVVVDDGSSDATAELAAASGARVISQSPEGVCAAIGRGVEAVTGEFIAFCDSDDRWTPRKLERQLAAMKREDAPALVFGHVRQFISPELDAAARAALKPPPAEPLPGIYQSTLLMRTERWHEVGPHRDEFGTAHFIDWHARATDLGMRSEVLPEVLVERRLHTSNTAANGHEAYTRAVRAALARRRATP